MTRSESAPSLEEYVVARGSDLVRLAWFLSGDAGSADDLVVDTLGRAARDWHGLTDDGGGAIDTTLTRRLLRTFLHGHDTARDTARDPARDPAGDLVAGSTGAIRGRPLAPGGAWAALLGLPRQQRAVLVLRHALDEPVERVALLLETSVATVASRERAALEGFGRSESGARAVLPALVPSDPSTHGLTSRARDRVDGRRRARTVASSALAAIVVVAAAVVAATTSPRTVLPGPGPTTTAPAALSCRTSTGEASVPSEGITRLSATATAVLLCARRDDDSVWPGSLPPDDELTDPRAIDLVTIEPRTSGAECAPLVAGPTYRLLVRDRDGRVRSYENEVLACNGWPLLSRYYVAVSEQRAAQDQASAGFLGCPSLLGNRPDTNDASPKPLLPKGTVFTLATACLHQLPRDDVVPRFREVRSNVLGAPQLARLNADAEHAGSALGAMPSCPSAGSLVVVRMLTSTNALLEVSGACGSAFSVDWSTRDVWNVSPDTASMLRALLVGR
jgi:DNA-directed RNA polymerase specialized sigma24 family protein